MKRLEVGPFFGVIYSFSFQIKEQQEVPAWALSLVKHVAVWDCQKNDMLPSR